MHIFYTLDNFYLHYIIIKYILSILFVTIFIREYHNSTWESVKLRSDKLASKHLIWPFKDHLKYQGSHPPDGSELYIESCCFWAHE